MDLNAMFAKEDARRATDAERFAQLDNDECQLCGAYGADKRTLVLRYSYAIHEVVPEVIDLSDVDGPMHGDGYMLRTCKTCRGEFLSMMEEWRHRRVARCHIPKDHDGYENEMDADDMIPVRMHGRTVWMTKEQYDAR